MKGPSSVPNVRQHLAGLTRYSVMRGLSTDHLPLLLPITLLITAPLQFNPPQNLSSIDQTPRRVSQDTPDSRTIHTWYLDFASHLQLRTTLSIPRHQIYPVSRLFTQIRSLRQ